MGQNLTITTHRHDLSNLLMWTYLTQKLAEKAASVKLPHPDLSKSKLRNLQGIVSHSSQNPYPISDKYNLGAVGVRVKGDFNAFR